MTSARLSRILSRFGDLRIGVFGDFFVDRYFDIDDDRAEVSLETGLTAHQVVRVRTSPGGGGNVAWNAAALGAGRVLAVTCLGTDFDGFELKRLLANVGVDTRLCVETPDRLTPSYNKPMLLKRGRPHREMERLDVRSRTRMPRRIEDEILGRLEACVREADGVLVADQVPEENAGAVTSRVRRRLSELALEHPSKVFFCDSRLRIGRFRNVIIKPNRREAVAALGSGARSGMRAVREGALAMSRGAGRPVFVTLGEKGCLCASADRVSHVPTYNPRGPLDIVGAGDTFAAAALCALCAGASCEEAGLVGNLAASITIQQIGITGTATREQLKKRFREYVRQRREG